MRNLDEIVARVSHKSAQWQAGDVYFTILDFTYAYGQVELDQKLIDT